MPDHDPIRPDGGSRWARLSKTAAFWILMVLMFVVALQLVRGERTAAADFNYTEFQAMRLYEAGDYSQQGAIGNKPIQRHRIHYNSPTPGFGRQEYCIGTIGMADRYSAYAQGKTGKERPESAEICTTRFCRQGC